MSLTSHEISSVYVNGVYTSRFPRKKRVTRGTRISDDWAVDFSTGDIRYVGHPRDQGGTTVLELHRYLQTAFDSVDLITEPMPMLRYAGGRFKVKSDYYLGEEAAQHLREGTIINERDGSQFHSKT